MITEKEQLIIDQALSILERELVNTNDFLTGSEHAKSLCRLRLSPLEHEVFAVLFLNSQHQLICFDEMFTGTVDAASVYPREVVKAALKHNASSAIFSHNHPSGISFPSEADKVITRRLVDALSLIDVRVLDHIIVGSSDTYCFAEAGLL